MAARWPLVNLSGTISELPSGDSILGSGGDLVKSVLLPSPTTSDTVIVFHYTSAALTVSSITAVMPNGSATPSVTYKIRYGSSLASGTAVVTAGSTTTSTTTGNTVTTFDSASIPDNNFIWLEITAVSGTVPYVSVTLEMI